MCTVTEKGKTTCIISVTNARSPKRGNREMHELQYQFAGLLYVSRFRPRRNPKTCPLNQEIILPKSSHTQTFTCAVNNGGIIGRLPVAVLIFGGQVGPFHFAHCSQTRQETVACGRLKVAHVRRKLVRQEGRNSTVVGSVKRLLMCRKRIR